MVVTIYSRIFLQINDLATATDKKRLEQFTDIAGSLTWKEIQPKNVSLLKGKELKKCMLYH